MLNFKSDETFPVLGITNGLPFTKYQNNERLLKRFFLYFLQIQRFK